MKSNKTKQEHLIENANQRDRVINKSVLLQHSFLADIHSDFKLTVRPTKENIEGFAAVSTQKTFRIISLTTSFPLVSHEYYKTYRITALPMKLSPGIFSTVSANNKDHHLTKIEDEYSSNCYHQTHLHSYPINHKR